jgi:hypothetical protein
VKWCTHDSLPVTIHSRNSFPSSLSPEDVKEKSQYPDFWVLSSDILLPSRHRFCSIPVLESQCCVQFQWTTQTQQINLECDLLVLQISSSTHAASVACPWCAGSTTGINNKDVCLTISNTWLFDTALSLCHHQTALPIDDKFGGENRFWPQKLDYTMNFFMGPNIHCHFYRASTYPMKSIWITDSSVTCCMVTLQVHIPYTKIKSLINPKVTE